MVRLRTKGHGVCLFRFPCQLLFHRLLHAHNDQSSGAGVTGQKMIDAPNAVSPHPIAKTKFGFPSTILGTGIFCYLDGTKVIQIFAVDKRATALSLYRCIYHTFRLQTSTTMRCRVLEKLSVIIIYLWGSSGTKSTITATIY
jgi:hypothetical protein